MIRECSPFAPLARPRNVAAGLAAVTLVLGMINIGRSFGYDEAITYANFINEGSPRRALTTQVVFNNHPMFSLFQVVLWRFGLVGETAQRLAPVLCGAGTVGIVAYEVTRWRNAVGGAVAGLVVMMNPLFMPLYRSLRGYALATFAVLVAALLIRRSWHDPRQRWLVLQAICMVVAVTTHAYSAMTLLAVAVAALALGRVERRHLVTWLLAAVTTIIIMWPVLDDARANARARGNRYQPNFLRLSAEFVLGWNRWAVAITAVLVMTGVVVVARKSLRHTLAIGAAGFVIISTVVFVWGVVQPFDLYSRFFVSVVPFLAMLAGIGVTVVPRAPALAITTALWVALVPGVRDTLDIDSPIRDTAAIVDRARAAGYEVCGRSTEALVVYTSPLPDAGVEPDDQCDLLITVFRLMPEQIDEATASYGGRVALGGSMTLWAAPDVLNELGLST